MTYTVHKNVLITAGSWNNVNDLYNIQQYYTKKMHNIMQWMYYKLTKFCLFICLALGNYFAMVS